MNRGRPLTDRGGLTLLELAVAGAIFSMLGLALVLLYNAAYTAYSQGAGRLMLHQKARETVRRIAPLVMASFEDPEDGFDAMVEWPPPDNADHNALVLRTTEDWLAAGYPSATTSARAAPTPDDFDYFVYRVSLQGGAVLLERGTWDTPTSTFTPDGQARALGRSVNDGGRPVTIQSLLFRKMGANSVRVEIQVEGVVRNAQGQERDVVHTLQSIINVPHSSLRNFL